MKIRNLLFALVLLGVAMLGAQTVSNVTFAPRHPWNGLVDITFKLTGTFEGGKLYSVLFTGYDQDRNESFELKTFIGQTEGFTKAGTYTVTWDAQSECPEFAAKDFRIQAQLRGIEKRYLVIDLSGGKDATSYPHRFTDTLPDLSEDTCRTTELWLRRIPKGTFLMGSPEDELGHDSIETQHQVTLTQDFYIGVFEMTQKQYELVMGSNPSKYQGDTCPVEWVSYDDLRGTSANGGAGWPAKGHAVDATSFFGVLRAKTGLVFDLPTEAQWEYACRAGTTTALNSGKNLTDTKQCPNMAEVGRYEYNLNDGRGGYSKHTKVGSYLPNAWGLYDMHGNVREWCLDGAGGYPASAVTDPAGADSGSSRTRVRRGGSWSNDGAQRCRSAHRYSLVPSGRYGADGFRLVCLP